MLKETLYTINEETMLNESVDSVFQRAKGFKNDDDEYDDNTPLKFNFKLYKPKIMHTYRRHKVLKIFRSDSQRQRVPNLYLD